MIYSKKGLVAKIAHDIFLWFNICMLAQALTTIIKNVREGVPVDKTAIVVTIISTAGILLSNIITYVLTARQTKGYIENPKDGLFHKTDVLTANTEDIQKTCNKIDTRTEEMSKEWPKDLGELASAARATKDALKKSFDEERSNEEVLADVKKALLDKDYYLQEFKVLSNELDSKNREIEELKSKNQNLQKELRKYKREPEEELEL